MDFLTTSWYLGMNLSRRHHRGTRGIKLFKWKAEKDLRGRIKQYIDTS